jgi:uncharacterized protein (DUF2062 family)
MIHFTRDLARRWLGQLLHIADTPERTAAAFALGVFFGFSPLLGLHTILGVVFAFLLNLNRVAVLLGVYSNLPWIIGPYYAFATMVVGAPITRHKIPPGFKSQVAALFDLSIYQGQFWHQLVTILKPWIWPYTVGSTIGAIVLGGLAYPLALAFVTSRRRIQDLIHHERAPRGREK